MSMRYVGGLVTTTVNPYAANVTTSPNYAQYNGVFTLAQQAQAATSGQWCTDPFFKNTTLLLRADGTANASQNNTFIDSSTNNFTITRNGNTTQGTFSPYGNLWSNYFDGTGDYLGVSGLSNSTGSFTVEFWMYATGYGSLDYGTAIGASSSTNIFAIQTYSSSPNQLLGYVGSASGSGNLSPTLSQPVLNRWIHIAVVRNGSSLTFYENGISVATATNSNSINFGTAFNIGNWQGYTFQGYISNVRISTTTAFYTSNFTPSTTPLTAVSGTSLLTCQSNRFKDNSSNNFTLTVNGNTSVQRFSPFPAQTAYLPSVVGGSGYFDGAGDYIQTPSSSAFNLSGDFTVDLWVYFTGNPYGGGLSKEYIYSTATGGFAFLITGTQLKVSRTGVADDMTVNFTTVAGQWYHFAISRSSGTMGIYANGTRLGTASVSSNYTTGALLTASGNNGYLSSWRVVNGTGLYTGATLTVPTAPLTAITNTSLLCNFTNAGIPDAAMMNDLETVGNAQVSTSVKKYGTGSLKFDGTNTPDRLLLSPPYTNYTFGTGDFTIEAWIYITTGSRINGIYGDGSGGSRANYVFWVNTTQNLVLQQTTSGTVTVGTSAACPLNQWVFITACKVGTTAYLSINGNVETFTGLQASASGNPVSPTVGDYGNYGADRCFAGYIDDFRITKGVARYISNFTPPPVALPVQ